MYRYQPGQIIRTHDGPLFTEALRPVGFLARARGLLGTAGLGANAALWLDRCASIHMFGMRYAIDLAFLRAGTVLALFPAVAPMRVRACKGAEVALEMPLGAIERLQLKKGDALCFESTIGSTP